MVVLGKAPAHSGDVGATGWNPIACGDQQSSRGAIATTRTRAKHMTGVVYITQHYIAI